MRHAGWVRVGVVLAMVSFAGVASSHSGGQTGKSGKQGSICNTCHGGGKTPTVTLTGPTSLDAGTLAVYTLQIETDASITGMNAATTDGVLVGYADGGSTKTEDDEVVHSRTVRPDAGIVTYTFSMTAPEFGGKITLFAAGNACNNDGQTTGDEAAGTKLDIEVSGPPRPPEPEAGPPSTTPPSTPPAVDAGNSSDSGSDAGEPEKAVPACGDERRCEPGCSTGLSDRSSRPAGAMLGALVALAALVRVRRR